MILNRKEPQFLLSNEDLQKFFDSFGDKWDKQIKGKHEMEYLSKSELKKASIILYYMLPKSTFEIGSWRYVVEGYRIQRYDSTKIIQTNPILKKFSKTRAI